MRATGLVSTFVFQSSLPVSASSAYTFAAPSPKSAAYRMPAGVLTRATLMAARIAAPVSKNQWTQPVAALSEYTMPPALPTNTRPPAIVDCAFDCRSLGKSERPFELQARHVGGREPGHRGVLEARVVRRDAPAVPPRTRRRIERAFARVHIARCGGVMVGALANVLPVTNSEIGAPLGERTAGRHRDHRPGFERAQHAVGSHAAKHVAARRPVERRRRDTGRSWPGRTRPDRERAGRRAERTRKARAPRRPRRRISIVSCREM